MRKSLMVLCAVLGTSGAWAGGFIDHPAVYGGIGSAKTSFDDDGLYDDMGSSSDDTEDKGLHVFGGYQFNPYFAVELSSRDLGEYTARGSSFVYKQEFSALTIGAVGFLPLGSGFSLYGRIGAGGISLDEKYTSGSFHDRNDDSGGVSTLGAGVEFRNSGLAVRLGWETHLFTVQTESYFYNGSYYYYDEDEYDQRIDTFGLDIAYYFSL
ncbi:MAG: outer membrane beta-barrel protein [Spongiibacteraceae bacterium]